MLGHHGLPVESRDIFRWPLSRDEILALAGRVPPHELFSWRSPTARARALRPGSLSDDELIELLLEDPRLTRRPLIDAGDRLIVGADATALAALARR